MSRRLLQITNAIFALLTIILAGASFVYGYENPIYAAVSIPANPALDSNLRFMGGLGLGLGIALLWILPTIEKQGGLFRLIWATAFLGGLGRIVSYIVVGTPPIAMILFAALEVPCVPLLIYWQYRVSKILDKAR